MATNSNGKPTLKKAIIMIYNKNILDIHDEHRRITSVAQTKEGLFLVGYDADFITKEGWMLDDMEIHTSYTYFTFDDLDEAIEFAYSYYTD